MQLSVFIRVLAVGGAMIAAVGSATSNQQPAPTGYYPTAQPAQQQQQPGMYAPSAHGAPPSVDPRSGARPCETFCDKVVQCDLAVGADCMQQCRDSKLEEQDDGPRVLHDLAQSDCTRIAQLAGPQTTANQNPAKQTPANTTPVTAKQTPAHAPADPANSGVSTGDSSQKRTQWVCNAMGSWQKCEQNFQCWPQTTMMMGFGSTEALARVSAESQCSTAMTRLMSVNFTYRTNVTSRCRAISCSPPNAK
ncbi:MAG TPA: hypothetical protein VK427_20740 [Kofleriaceae bacterium]|nr:hypothetical protein [Kofleriaceae bacterium]